MAPRFSRDRDPADVLDPDTGKVRVLARRCATCIFRTDDPMHLGDDRTRQVIADNLRAGALLTCHATLPYGDHPHFGPAVCAGFWTPEPQPGPGWAPGPARPGRHPSPTPRRRRL